MTAEGGSDECLQCGLCCKIFGDRIQPTLENLFSWMEDGREDILSFFMACLEDGRWVRCTEIAPGDLSGIHAVELRDPATGGYLPVCPFLKRVAKNRYLCGIHAVKPEQELPAMDLGRDLLQPVQGTEKEGGVFVGAHFRIRREASCLPVSAQGYGRPKTLVS
jgi:Fe-S-cluster containining protein